MANREGGGGFGWLALGVLIGVAALLAAQGVLHRRHAPAVGPEADMPEPRSLTAAPEPPAQFAPPRPRIATAGGEGSPPASVPESPQAAPQSPPQTASRNVPQNADQVADDAAAAGMTSRAAN